MIRALQIVEAEFGSHVHRMENDTRAMTDDEKEHLADLKRGYAVALRYTRIMLNYQQGRVQQLERRLEAKRRRMDTDVAPPPTIDEAGGARAFTGEDE